jgi:hypothetical protein
MEVHQTLRGQTLKPDTLLERSLQAPLATPLTLPELDAKGLNEVSAAYRPCSVVTGGDRVFTTVAPGVSKSFLACALVGLLRSQLLTNARSAKKTILRSRIGPRRSVMKRRI